MTKFPRNLLVARTPAEKSVTRTVVLIDEGTAWCIAEDDETEFSSVCSTLIIPWPIWKEISTHTTRPMTHAEVLEKVTNTQGMVVRYSDDDESGWCPAQFFIYEHGGEGKEWAIIKNGVYSEPQKFEVPV